jgi:sugar lactone lactonase YvrE
MSELRVLLDGLGQGESPRWHDGRLWFGNWGTGEVVAVDPDGNSEVMARVDPSTVPLSIDWLPDGRLLVVAGPSAQVLVQADDGSLVTYADLSGIAEGFNELVVDGRGNAYVNGGSFDFENPTPGLVAVVTPDGSAREVADDIHFGNGMAITPDGSTLIVAESYASRLTAFDIEPDGGLSNRRVWAPLGDGVPDGICLDAEGAVWYADVPNRRCVRVREGGDVLATVDLDRGGFACMLGGGDGRTLFMMATEWKGFEGMADAMGTGQVVATRVDVPHAGRP